MAGNGRVYIEHSKTLPNGPVTARLPPSGYRRKLGYPPDAVLQHHAPQADRTYLKSLLSRAQRRLAEIIEAPLTDQSQPQYALAHIATDGRILCAGPHTQGAHNTHPSQCAAHITLYIRDRRSGALRAQPLPMAGKDNSRTARGVIVTDYDVYAPAHGITRHDDIFICLQNPAAARVLSTPESLAALARYMKRGADSARCAAFLARLARRGGVAEHISVTFGPLPRGHAQPVLLALFFGKSAKSNRLAAAMAPVITGLLQHDMIMLQRQRFMTAQPPPP